MCGISTEMTTYEPKIHAFDFFSPTVICGWYFSPLSENVIPFLALIYSKHYKRARSDVQLVFVVSFKAKTCAMIQCVDRRTLYEAFPYAFKLMVVINFGLGLGLVYHINICSKKHECYVNK